METVEYLVVGKEAQSQVVIGKSLVNGMVYGSEIDVVGNRKRFRIGRLYVDQMVLEFPILADYCYLNLSGDPEEKNSDVTIFATHGHVYNPHKLPMLKNGDILLNGHTHIPACEEILDMNGGKYQYLNPGSVSIPKEGSEHSYMIYENGVFTWKNLAGEEYQTWKTVSHS